MALSDKATKDIGPTKPPPVAPSPENYTSLLERYFVDTRRLTTAVKVLSVTTVTAGLVGYLVGRQAKPSVKGAP